MPSPLLRGATPMLILRVVRDEAHYGYQIAQRIRLMTGATLTPSEGALYPTLHRLETDGSLAAEWRDSAHGPRRRYYSLTERGETRLAAYEREWANLQVALGQAMRPSTKAG